MPEAFNKAWIFRIQPLKTGSLCPAWALAQLSWSWSGCRTVVGCSNHREAKAKDHQGKGDRPALLSPPRGRRKVAESRGEQGARGEEGFVGLSLETMLFCWPGAECGTIPAVQGLCRAGMGTSPSVSHLAGISLWRLPALPSPPTMAMVTHVVASSSTFKETRGEPKVKACHSAPSELAINTIACPRGSKKATGGASVGGRCSQRQHGTSQAALPKWLHQRWHRDYLTTVTSGTRQNWPSQASATGALHGHSSRKLRCCIPAAPAGLVSAELHWAKTSASGCGSCLPPGLGVGTHAGLRAGVVRAWGTGTGAQDGSAGCWPPGKRSWSKVNLISNFLLPCG